MDHKKQPMTPFTGTYRHIWLRNMLWTTAVLLPIIGLMAFASWQKYRDATEKAALQTRNLTRVLALQLEADFTRIDDVLRFAASFCNTLPQEHQFHGSAPLPMKQQQSINRQLQELQKSFNGIQAINVFDAEGNLRYSSLPVTTSINVADRAFFRYLKSNPQAQTAFSDIIISRTTGLRALVQARALRDTKGRFLGNINTIYGSGTD
jgi:hypothetical protein